MSRFLAQRAVLIFSSLTLLAVSCARPERSPAPADRQEPAERMAWWRDARFGLFIHWGLYSIPAGEWNGSTGHAEWIRTTARIPLEEYEGLVQRFDPVDFDADAWARMARDAGMRYVVITTKHHDGFCLFDSRLTDFDVMSTPFHRDIMRELADACRRQGLRMCWYHSIMDWHHPDYLPRRDWEIRPAEGADMRRYRQYLFGQVEELLTNYGPIGVMWFDGEWEGTWTHADGVALYELCRRLQPDVIVNNRVDKGRGGMAGLTKAGEYRGDFGTPEQEIPATGLPGVDWETCMTMNDHWGYNALDEDFKSTSDLVRKLVDIVSKGGNFLLNVGPTAKGTFPEESVQRLAAIGAWMDVNGEAIHGSEASPFEELSWGRCTQKPIEGGTRLYLCVFEWPDDGVLLVPGLGNRARRAFLLADPDRALTLESGGEGLRIGLPPSAPDPVVSVVAVDVEGPPVVYETPRIVAEADVLVDRIEVRLETRSGGLEIRYTLDGGDPGPTSPAYDRPIALTAAATVRARSFHQGRPVGAVAERRFARVEPLAASPVGDLAGGLVARDFSGDWDALPAFEELAPEAEWTAATVGLRPGPVQERHGLLLSGYLEVPRDALYRFALVSDDGSRLVLDGRTVVDNDGLHGIEERRGVLALAAGWHALAVEYFNKTGGAELELLWAPVGAELVPVASGSLGHLAPR